MKSLISLPVFLISTIFTHVSAEQLPGFLAGTWKTENAETYEHWDKINDNKLKGFSCQIENGKIAVSEYLEINKNDEGVFYTATVLNQNEGVGIDFKLIKTDSVFSFENSGHDFPKFIRYRQISENRMEVVVGTDESSFSLSFKKVE